ncbi:MAG: FliO/MopB family protein [Phenylobacterium sp.]
MDLITFARAAFALLFTLGLIGVAAVLLRRFGPGGVFRISSPRQERRMRILETLILDPARRLVLVECDGETHLLMLGEGRTISGSGRNAERRE